MPNFKCKVLSKHEIASVLFSTLVLEHYLIKNQQISELNNFMNHQSFIVINIVAVRYKEVFA